MRVDTAFSAQASSAKPSGTVGSSSAEQVVTGLALEQGNAWATACLAVLISPLPQGRHYRNSPIFLEQLVPQRGGQRAKSLISCSRMRKGRHVVPVSSASFKSHPACLGPFPSFNALPGQTETVPPQPPRASPVASHNRNELPTLFLLLLPPLLLWTGINLAGPAKSFPSVPIQISINKRCQNNLPM